MPDFANGGIGVMTFKIEANSRQLRGGHRFFTHTAQDALIKAKALRTLCAPGGIVAVYNNGTEISVNELERLAKREYA